MTSQAPGENEKCEQSIGKKHERMTSQAPGDIGKKHERMTSQAPGENEKCEQDI